MDIQFRTGKLRKICESGDRMRREFGTQAAGKLEQRLTELQAAPNLADLRQLPHLGCHELRGDREGQLAISVHGGLRLVFTVDHSPFPTKDDGGLDWLKVTRISVLDVINYHD